MVSLSILVKQFHNILTSEKQDLDMNQPQTKQAQTQAHPCAVPLRAHTDSLFSHRNN